MQEKQAREALKTLLDKYYDLDKEARQQTTEANVVRQFIDPLFSQVLGWPIHEPERYKYELSTQVGRPDITLIPEGKAGIVFVEAKRFNAIDDLPESANTLVSVLKPEQMALPGMAIDRTPEEQQAINYAFGNGGQWAILTNFEKLRLFNARRDWLVIAFEDPRAYEREFDQLWQLAYHNILNGSLNALSNQRYRADIDNDYLQLINTWRERLALDVVAHAAENPWAFDSGGRINLTQLRAVVQRFIDRVVILRFAEDHLVIPAGALQRIHDLAHNNIYAPVLTGPLRDFFANFDRYHNSALFAPGLVDQAHFSNKVLLSLLADLYRARYRSMPADIIGNTYEQYLGKTLVLDNGSVTTRDNLETRKKQGSYYTPQVIVQYIVDSTLGRYLYGTRNGKPDGDPIEGETRKTSRDIGGLRVLDSACGSGSFLIYAYEVLRDFYEGEISRMENEINQHIDLLAAQGEDEFEIRTQTSAARHEVKRLQGYPRLILESHLYGVDLDPQAAEIATVNLIMRAMEGRHDEKRLPLILNQNVKVGNGLIGMRPDDSALTDYAEQLAEIRRLRAALVKAPHGETHDQITRDLANATATLRDTLTDAMNLPEHFTDMERVRPFHWAAEFPEVFVGDDGQALDEGGFTVVIGNPPWEIVKPDLREFFAQFDADIESRLSRKKAEARIEELKTEDPRREAEWLASSQHITASAAWFGASEDYSRQGRGDRATHKLFMERAWDLLRGEGRLGYVVPSGIYTDLGTKQLREMLLNEGRVDYMYGLANVREFFAGVDSRFKFTLLGVQKGGQTESFRVMFLLGHAEWPLPEGDYDASAILSDVIYDKNRVFNMSVDLIRRFSPDSLSMMEFKSARDYEIAEQIYGDWPLIGDEVTDSWNIRFTSEFHMTSDRHLFNTGGHGLPLYEGKMIHQFDAFLEQPRFWIEEATGKQRFENRTGNDYQRARLVFRDIARSTDERSYIAAVVPPNVFVGNTGIVETKTQGTEMVFLLAMLNSFSNDHLIRYKIGTHVNIFYAKQLPLPRLTAGNPYFDAIVPRAARLTCTRPEFADLWAEVMSTAWDESCGVTDADDRQQLRDEIDALVAHLYGLSREDFAHILGTFPLVFPDNEAGAAKMAALLAEYDRWVDEVRGWARA